MRKLFSSSFLTVNQNLKKTPDRAQKSENKIFDRNHLESIENSKESEPQHIKVVSNGIEKASPFTDQIPEEIAPASNEIGSFLPLESPLNKEHFLISPQVSPILEKFSSFEALKDCEDITEIILQGPNNIWYEQNGELLKAQFSLGSDSDYTQFFNRVMDEAGLIINYNYPSVDGQWDSFRVHAVIPPVSLTPSLTLRKQKSSRWDLKQLDKNKWGTPKEIQFLKGLVQNKKNILIIGETGCGKTSVLEALLNEVSPNERCIVMEDSPEIKLPNESSCRLLCRFDPQGVLPTITMTDLIKYSLRMRPHRLLMGEIRSVEAKDYLLSLSTGHTGSLASLHAECGAQALLRLEMLVQMASDWSLESIRKLLYLSLNYIVTVGLTDGKRHLKKIEKICGLESTGLLLEEVDF